MMGRLNHDQKQFFYSFSLDEAVPDDHPVRSARDPGEAIARTFVFVIFYPIDET